MIASAGLALAASRFAYLVASETGDVDGFKKATSSQRAQGNSRSAPSPSQSERDAFVETDEERVRRERLETVGVRVRAAVDPPCHPVTASRLHRRSGSRDEDGRPRATLHALKNVAGVRTHRRSSADVHASGFEMKFSHMIRRC